MKTLTTLKALLTFFVLLSFNLTNAQVGIGTTTPTAQLTVTQDAIFNESGGNNNFRVESSGFTNMFNIDAANDAFGFYATPNNTTIIGQILSQIYDPVEIGNDGGGGFQVSIGSYVGPEPLMVPETDFYGYNGVYDFVNQNAWFEVNAYDLYNISNRGSKRNIYSINDDPAIENYVLNDIDNIKPSFYKYQHDLDEMIKGNETKYRPQMRLGVITDEAPDYVTDATNSKVSVYSVATMSLVGVKHNRKKIQELEEKLELTKISDFGSLVLNGKEVEVTFDNDFSDKLNGSAIVTVTSNNPNINVSITRKTKNGFLVVASEHVTDLSIDWIAMGKASVSTKSYSPTTIDSNLKNQLELSQDIKQRIIEYQRTNKPAASFNGNN